MLDCKNTMSICEKQTEMLFFPYSFEEPNEHSLGRVVHKTGPILFTVQNANKGWVDSILAAVQERTIKVTVPFVRLRMATASSWVTPSRLCPLTAMIWSPLFKRPSSEAAPFANTVLT